MRTAITTNTFFRDRPIDFFGATIRRVQKNRFRESVVNLRFVETFVWVARLQSISRTAEKLFLTQSAVSSRITVLEQEIGAPLLDRRDRLFRLTSAGERFLTYAERLLALQHDLKYELCGNGIARFSLRLGAIETILHAWLIPTMERLRRSKPHIEFELNVETTPVLHQQIRRGGLDLIFSADQPFGKGIVSERFPSLEMVFVGPDSLKEGTYLHIDELMSWELLTFQRDSQPHMALVDCLGKAGVTNKRVHTVTSISALVKLAESGFGLATLPRVAVDELKHHHGIVPIRTALQLVPLPLFASYLNPPATPELEESISEALVFVREAAGAKSAEPTHG